LEATKGRDPDLINDMGWRVFPIHFSPLLSYLALFSDTFPQIRKKAKRLKSWQWEIARVSRARLSLRGRPSQRLSPYLRYARIGEV
jgi:hypothetical protein